MTSYCIFICVFFSFTLYIAVASFLEVSSLRPRRISSNNVSKNHWQSLFASAIDDEESHHLNEDVADSREKKVRFRSRVAYCGTPFCGWQLQPQRTTVQGEIEDALFRRYNRRIAVVGAGRTDAGVHARGQAIHFDLFEAELPFPSVTCNATSDERHNISADFCSELQYSLNRMMRQEIRLFQLQLAPFVMTMKGQAYDESNEEEQQAISLSPRLRPWHAIQSSTSKWYSYRFTLGPTLYDPMERFTRTHFVHRPSFAPSDGPTYAITTEDISRLKSILDLYVGTHDFKAFGGQLEQTEKRAGKKINTIRTIHKVELVNESLLGESRLGFIGEEGDYRIDFLIEGALYKMIRNMVGTAIQVWLGKMEEELLIELLKIEHSGHHGGEEEVKSRKNNPCKPAPPEGLTLECVYYDDSF